MATYSIKGIISAERPCECCGNKNLEKNVVLESQDGTLLYVGSTCAGKLLYGKKTRKNANLVIDEAKAVEYAKKWIGVHGTDPEVLQMIANAIRVRYCNAIVHKGELLIGRQIASYSTR